jgi:hypothetical protein
MQNKLEQLLKLINFTFDIGFGEINPHWSFLKECNIHNTSLSINNDMLYIKEFNNVREVSLIHLFVEYNHIINSKYMNFFYCLLLLQWKFEANDLFLRNQNNKEFQFINYKTMQFGNELPLEYSSIITIPDEYKSFYKNDRKSK